VTTDDRRTAIRCPFTAGLSATDETSQAALQSHTTDLSQNGCYVDTMNPFPKGTEIKVRLTHDNASFQAIARVVYCQTGVGMGLLFTHIDPAERPVLDRWLAELRGEAPAAAQSPEPPEVRRQMQTYKESAPANGERAAIEDLVHTLVEKDLLNDEEAGKILRRLTDLF
jgi:hypothetical protein